MFHATVWIVGQEHEPIFLKRTFHACIALHPFHGFDDLAEDELQLGDLLEIVVLPIKGADGIAVADRCLFLELSGNKGIEVCRNGFGSVAEHRLPSFRHVQRSGEPCPDVRLVETREGRVGLVWQEDRV